ncbi:Phosphoribosyl-ATP pyrophosphatase [Candidatus Hodgkinia cicadicola]|uniref:Phosphoribosyl-ATP pyrophosphatase n=1 Tax=Candidatus Hodgkinia cicadicola TaxID=573658 RepID=A0ABX4MFX6_9HYPH|nr:Phosphoribosyl-ATP pyrophosphatase [Candidatus Hodgkinia cicadicola]
MINNILFNQWSTYYYWDLHRLMFLVYNRSKMLYYPRSCTTELPFVGTRFILRTMKQKQTELLIAVYFRSRREMIMKSVDLMYCIIYLFIIPRLNFNQILKSIDIRTNSINQQYALNAIRIIRILNYKYRMNCSSLINKHLNANSNGIILINLNNMIMNLILAIDKFKTTEPWYYTMSSILLVNMMHNIVALGYNNGIELREITNAIVSRNKIPEINHRW